MADVSQIQNFPLKVTFLVYTLLLSVASTGYWAPSSYLFYNILIIALLLPVIFYENLESLQLALCVNAFSFFLDVVVVSLHFSSNYIFAGVFAIIFLLIKPGTTFVLFKISRDKAQATGPIRDINDIFVTGRSSYEDIDHNVPQQPPQPKLPSQGGYNFSTAQQL